MAKKIPKDPGAPKRNMSAYLLYQNAMREQFKAQNPGMTFGQLAKYTSAMYSELTPAEKEAWVQRAEADKQRYLHELSTYIPPPGFDAKGDAIMTNPPQATFRGVKRSSSSKLTKDVNAPKRNLSAYLLYQNAMRNHFKAENPGMTFGQLAKYTSHMYKNLTPEERAAWDARSQADRERYEAEMAGYVPPPGHDAQGVLIEAPHHHYAGGTMVVSRGKRARRDPAAPKRARGSFVFFTFDMRPQVMREFPGIKFVEMGTVLGERWRAISPEEKKRYEDMSAQDKVRFHLEMQKYQQTQAAAASAAAAQQQALAQAQAVPEPAPVSLQQQYQPQAAPQEQQQQYQYTDPNQPQAPPQPQEQQNYQYQQYQQF
mmetsp:Transcript_63891/g.74830  ORF Transcript_63891/g.74830 Transcript_63891/m.74830 type:complete len:371 (+) Transcript_63891:127-1239(+)